MTEEEIATIAAKHRMAKFPNLALTRERLSRKAKAEPKFRFYTLYGRVVDEETIRCAWERVWKKDKAPGVDGQTFEAIERGEGGVEGFLASIQRELKAKTYRASSVRRVYIKCHIAGIADQHWRSGLRVHTNEGNLAQGIGEYFGELWVW